MNYSLLSAGRTTHLKIVAVALVSAIVVVFVGINARDIDTRTQPNRTVVKAVQPATFAGNEQTVR